MKLDVGWASAAETMPRRAVSCTPPTAHSSDPHHLGTHNQSLHRALMDDYRHARDPPVKNIHIRTVQNVAGAQNNHIDDPAIQGSHRQVELL